MPRTHVPSAHHLPEHHVLAVARGVGARHDAEGAAVGVGHTRGRVHGQQALRWEQGGVGKGACSVGRGVRCQGVRGVLGWRGRGVRWQRVRGVLGWRGHSWSWWEGPWDRGRGRGSGRRAGIQGRDAWSGYDCSTPVGPWPPHTRMYRRVSYHVPYRNPMRDRMHRSYVRA